MLQGSYEETDSVKFSLYWRLLFGQRDRVRALKKILPYLSFNELVNQWRNGSKPNMASIYTQ